MSKRLTELQKERDDKVKEYNNLESQKNDIAKRQNEIGKELLTLNGKIEAYEEMKKKK